MFKSTSRILTLAFMMIIANLMTLQAQAASIIDAAPALQSNGGSLTTFNQAVNMHLQSDADYGRFVEPQVTGINRALAIKFMRLMPANLRSDFIYISPNGALLSNRPALAFNLRPMTPALVKSLRASSISSPTLNPLSISTMQAKKQLTNRLSMRPMSYPPTSGNGGAYGRMYSSQGFNAMFGFVVPPCDVNLASGESGDAYFNAYDSNGNDQVDAGIATNIGVGSGTGATYGSYTHNSVMFVSIPTQGGYQSGFTYGQGYSPYPCGQPIGMMYGSEAAPNQNISALLVGIPYVYPEQLALPPQSTIMHGSTWLFFQTPSALLVNPTSGSLPSNCSGCSVARMTSIAQNPPGSPPNLDGSCYGLCPNSYGKIIGADLYWYKVAAGNLTSPCQDNGTNPPSAQCTITISTTQWSNGYYSNIPSAVDNDPVNNEYGTIGIDLDPGYSQGAPSSQQSLPSGLPPAPNPFSTCTPDSHGYCAVTVGGQSGTCYSGPAGDQTGTELDTYTSYVFTPGYALNLVEIATNKVGYQGVYCNKPYNTWSPQEPKVRFSDPNLP